MRTARTCRASRAQSGNHDVGGVIQTLSAKKWNARYAGGRCEEVAERKPRLPRQREELEKKTRQHWRSDRLAFGYTADERCVCCWLTSHFLPPITMLSTAPVQVMHIEIPPSPGHHAEDSMRFPVADDNTSNDLLQVPGTTASPANDVCLFLLPQPFSAASTSP